MLKIFFSPRTVYRAAPVPSGTGLFFREPFVPDPVPCGADLTLKGLSLRSRSLVRPVFICVIIMNYKKVMAFVDGYNFYHSILEMIRSGPMANREDLKWVDLWMLMNAFIMPSKESLVGVHYFSAYATWKPEAMVRHRQYVRALQHVGVTVKMGSFKERQKKCRYCGSVWPERSEKGSDVNLAIELVNQAHHGNFDKALILTADTDLIPAIQMVRELHPTVAVHAVLPRQRYIAAHAMRGVCNGAIKLNETHLERSLLPAEIHLCDGGVITRPVRYSPPATLGRRF